MPMWERNGCPQQENNRIQQSGLNTCKTDACKQQQWRHLVISRTVLIRMFFPITFKCALPHTIKSLCVLLPLNSISVAPSLAGQLVPSKNNTGTGQGHWPILKQLPSTWEEDTETVWQGLLASEVGFKEQNFVFQISSKHNSRVSSNSPQTLWS